MGLGGSHLNVPGGGTDGLQVFSVAEGSPGHKAGLEAYFDFIISINGVRLDSDNEKFKLIIKENVNKPINLVVYNSKSSAVRELTVTPDERWGGRGLLGISIQFNNFDKAHERIWHVLDVQPHSPAALAGLHSYSDYIVGAETALSDSEDFYVLIERKHGTPIRFFVYNYETDKTRSVILTPNHQWGGEGSLGCGIGYGYLHRIPMHRPSTAPVTKSNPLLLNGDKPLSVASIPPPKMNFTFQPKDMPPLTITMPNIILPQLVNPQQIIAGMNQSQSTQSSNHSQTNQLYSDVTQQSSSTTSIPMVNSSQSHLSQQSLPVLNTNTTDKFKPVVLTTNMNIPNAHQYYFQPIPFQLPNNAEQTSTQSNIQFSNNIPLSVPQATYLSRT